MIDTSPVSPSTLLHLNIARAIAQLKSPIAAEQAIGIDFCKNRILTALQKIDCLRPYTTSCILRNNDGVVSAAIDLNKPYPSELQDLQLLQAIALVLRQELSVRHWSLVGSDGKGCRCIWDGVDLHIERLA